MNEKKKAPTGKNSKKRKQLLMRDLEGFLYIVPNAEADKYRVNPEELPAVLEHLSKEMPDLDWSERGRTKALPAAAAAGPKAVDVVISFGGGVAAAKAVDKVNNCCVIDCCVTNCCILDCGCVSDCSCIKDSPAPTGPSHCKPVDGPGCRPVR